MWLHIIFLHIFESSNDHKLTVFIHHLALLFVLGLEQLSRASVVRKALRKAKSSICNTIFGQHLEPSTTTVFREDSCTENDDDDFYDCIDETVHEYDISVAECSKALVLQFQSIVVQNDERCQNNYNDYFENDYRFVSTESICKIQREKERENFEFGVDSSFDLAHEVVRITEFIENCSAECTVKGTTPDQLDCLKFLLNKYSDTVDDDFDVDGATERELLIMTELDLLEPLEKTDVEIETERENLEIYNSVFDKYDIVSNHCEGFTVAPIAHAAEPELESEPQINVDLEILSHKKFKSMSKRVKNDERKRKNYNTGKFKNKPKKFSYTKGMVVACVLCVGVAGMNVISQPHTLSYGALDLARGFVASVISGAAIAATALGNTAQMAEPSSGSSYGYDIANSSSTNLINPYLPPTSEILGEKNVQISGTEGLLEEFLEGDWETTTPMPHKSA